MVIFVTIILCTYAVQSCRLVEPFTLSVHPTRTLHVYLYAYKGTACGIAVVVAVAVLSSPDRVARAAL